MQTISYDLKKKTQKHATFTTDTKKDSEGSEGLLTDIKKGRKTW